MAQVNVQFVYGAGNDQMFGGGLREIQAAVIKKFGAQVYSPRIVDYTEYDTLVRLIGKWKDPTILVGHSCGCMSAVNATIANSMIKFPYVMAIAPSIYCPMGYLAPNVARATQATSWWGDFFNPFGRQLLQRSAVNNKSVVDVIATGASHLNAPYSPLVRDRVIAEIQRVLG